MMMHRARNILILPRLSAFFVLLATLSYPGAGFAYDYPEPATRDPFSTVLLNFPTGLPAPAHTPGFQLGGRGVPAVELPLGKDLTLNVQSFFTAVFRFGILAELWHGARSGLALRAGAGSSPYQFGLFEADLGLHQWFWLPLAGRRGLLLSAGAGMATAGDWDDTFALPFRERQNLATFNAGGVAYLADRFALLVAGHTLIGLQGEDFLTVSVGGRYFAGSFGVQFGLWRMFSSTGNLFNDILALPYLSLAWRFPPEPARSGPAD